MPLHNCPCDYVGSASPKTLASVHEAEVSDTEESTSVKSILIDDITRPLNFDRNPAEIKPPAQTHLPDWDPPSGLLPRTAPYRAACQWYARNLLRTSSLC